MPTSRGMAIFVLTTTMTTTTTTMTRPITLPLAHAHGVVVKFTTLTCSIPHGVPGSLDQLNWPASWVGGAFCVASYIAMCSPFVGH